MLRSRFSRAIVVALAINLICVAALLWSTTERLHVTIVVSGETVTGTVGSASVSAPTEGLSSGQVGFFLQGSDPHATIAWPSTSSTGASAPPRSISDLLYRLGAESAWTNVTVRDRSTHAPLYPTQSSEANGAAWSPRFGDWFHHPFGGETTARPGLSVLGSPNWHEYQVDADLLRPRNAAGVLVLSPDGTNGMLLYFRPEDRDVVWYQVRQGQWVGPVASAPFHTFHQDAVASTQDVLRLTLGGYPGALGLIILATALGALEAALRGRWSVRAEDRSMRPTRYNRLPALGALILVIAALGSTLYVADVVLQRMPHVQDSVAYLFQAKTFALGRLSVPLPADPAFFEHEFIVMNGGQWFSKYPPGWPMLLAVGVLARAPWVVNPVCAALSILVIYRLGAEIFRPRVGLLAAALGVVSPFFLFLSGSMMSHSSGLLLALLFVWGFWRATRSPRPIWPAVWCGAAFGMGFLIRPYTMIAIAVPFALYVGWKIGIRPLDGARRYLPAATAAVPFVVAFLAYNAHFTGNPFYPPQQLWWAFDSVGFGPLHGPWGFTPIDALNNTSRNLLELIEHTYGWPEFLTLAFAMVPFLTGRFRAWDWLFAGGFVALIAGYGLWWADGIMYGPRFYYEALGFFLLLTARGIDVTLDLARWGIRSPPPPEQAKPTSVRIPGVLAPSLAYVLVALLVAFNFAFYFPGQWQLYHGYNYVNHAKLDAAQHAGIHHALVFADVGESYAWWEYGMVFSANDPLLQGDVIFARDLGPANDQRLMADFPGRSFYRLNGTQVSKIAMDLAR